MADFSAFGTYIPECHFLCDVTKPAVQRLENHFLAVVIYSTIIGVVTATVVRKDYFKKLFDRLKVRGIDTEGAKDVWHFTLAIFLFNATLHIIQLTEWTRLDYAPLPDYDWLTVSRIVYWSGNAGLWLWAAALYRRDAKDAIPNDPGTDKSELFDKRNGLLIAYFTQVVVLFAFDDTLSKNWDLLRVTKLLGILVDNYKTWHGWAVPITLIVVFLTAVGSIVLAMRYQEKVRAFGWACLVYLVPFALPIAAVLAVSVGGAVYFYSGVGNSNTAQASTVRTIIPTTIHKTDTKTLPLFD